jgi:serine phosphatase RsbU (regulator of sigma subunit)
MIPVARSMRRITNPVERRDLMVPATRSGWIAGIAVAVAAPILAATLVEATGGRPYLTVPFLVAILLATAVGRLIAGLLAVFISSALIDYLFIGPGHAFGPLRSDELLSLITFGVVALVIAEVLAYARIARRVADDARERAEESEVRFGLLAEASRLLASSLEYETTMTQAVRLAARHLGDSAQLFLIDERGQLVPTASAGSDPDIADTAGEVSRFYVPELSNERSYVARAFLTGERQVVVEVSDEELRSYARSDEELATLRQLRVRSGLALPLAVRGTTFGVLALANSKTDRRYDEEDLIFADELARRIARSVENSRLFAERDRIARTLQDSLLPSTIPSPPGIEVAFRYAAAGAMYDVGGDFYDLFRGEDESWVGVVGDVCGKGPEAAAVMGIARFTLRAHALRESRPSALLTGLNDALLAQRASRFCTVACTRLRRVNDHIRVTSCVGGHPRPLVIRADGSTDLVGRFGTLLGVFDDLTLTDVAIDLQAGDALVLYTDGLEARDMDAEEGVLLAVGEKPIDSAEELADRILAYRTGKNADPQDDLAVLVLLVTTV